MNAVVLADMHRSGYTASCYVPDVKTSEERKIVRHRSGLVRRRTSCKKSIHVILLQPNFQAKAAPSSTPPPPDTLGEETEGHRVGDFLEQIELFNSNIRKADRRIAKAVRENRNAVLISSIPDSQALPG